MAVDLGNWEKLINKIAKDLHEGKLKPADLNADLINKTYTKLSEGAAKGYGKDWIKFDPVNSKTVQRLKSNLYLFSGAKTYQQLQEMHSLLVDDDGKIRGFNAFKKEVLKVHQRYNVNYLQAEYQTAKASAQMARKWNTFIEQKKLYPNLKYITVGDGRVREEHQELHGTIRPINDSFWDTHYPPNGWRCRCSVTNTADAVTPKDKIPKVEITKGFENNVGKTGQIFSKAGHPYFSIPQGDMRSVKKAMELNKLLHPHYIKAYEKKGASVWVSAHADSNDLYGNYRAAVKMVNKGISVKIRAHIELKKYSNPELLINKLFSERKSPVSLNGFRGLLKSTKKQCENELVNTTGTKYILVLDLSNTKDYSYKELTTQLNKNINNERYKRLQAIIVIRGENVAEISREAIVKKNYTKLLKIQ